jgi:hypothetical protein
VIPGELGSQFQAFPASYIASFFITSSTHRMQRFLSADFLCQRGVIEPFLPARYFSTSSHRFPKREPVKFNDSHCCRQDVCMLRRWPRANERLSALALALLFSIGSEFAIFPEIFRVNASEVAREHYPRLHVISSQLNIN